MSIADHLNLLASNKVGIKEALEEKGVEVGGSPFSHYPDLIEEIKAGDFEIGKILYGKMDRDDGEWLIADGSRVNKDIYPEIVEMLGEAVGEEEYNLLSLQDDIVLNPSRPGYNRSERSLMHYQSNTLIHPTATDSIAVVEMDNWTTVVEFETNFTSGWVAAISKNGQMVAVHNGSGNGYGRMKIFSIAGEELTQLSHSGDLAGTSFGMSDSKFYLLTKNSNYSNDLTLNEYSVADWDPTDRTMTVTASGTYRNRLTISPNDDNRLYVALSNSVWIDLITWTRHTLAVNSSAIAILLSPDGRYLVRLNADGAGIYDLIGSVSGAAHNSTTIINGSNNIVAGHITHDGKTLLLFNSGGGIGLLRLIDNKWHKIDETTTKVGQLNEIFGITPDGHGLVVSTGRTLRRLPFCHIQLLGYATLPNLPPQVRGDTTFYPMIKVLDQQ